LTSSGTHRAGRVKGARTPWPGDLGWSSGGLAILPRNSSSLLVCAVAWDGSSWSARRRSRVRRRSRGRTSWTRTSGGGSWGGEGLPGVRGLRERIAVSPGVVVRRGLVCTHPAASAGRP
jgi:hypothetical protein